jgi:DNA-binding transcriptional LysR family regulator
VLDKRRREIPAAPSHGEEAMPEILDIAHLRTFAAIADRGGFGRAAAHLHLSQPTVSQHVRALERTVNDKLVRKVGREARLTRSGEQLLDQARRILAVHDEALLSFAAPQQQGLVIGCTPTAAETGLPQLLETLREAFPTRAVRFLIDSSAALTAAVGRGAADLAIVLGSVPADGEPGRTLGSLPLDWYGAARGTDEGVADTASVSLIALPAPCGIRRRAVEVLADAGRGVDIVAEVSSLDGALAAARAGLGVAALPLGRRFGQPSPELRGLARRADLPALGNVDVTLLHARDTDAETEDTALEALEQLFADGVADTRIPA